MTISTGDGPAAAAQVPNPEAFDPALLVAVQRDAGLALDEVASAARSELSKAEYAASPPSDNRA